MAQDEQQKKPEPRGNKPIIRLVSPVSGYVMPGDGPDLLMTLEIIDVRGVGFEEDRKGVPQFTDLDDNAKLFLRYVLSVGKYTNGRGQRVTQLVSEVPIHKLTPHEEQRVTPPINSREINWEQYLEGFIITPDVVIPLAPFHFRIKDKAGGISETDDPPFDSLFVIGLATEIYKPPVNIQK
jgi:hypothetical protein